MPIPKPVLNSPANHLDPDTIGNPNHPNIQSGTWLVIPGGTILFRWNAPVASRSGAPVNALVTGAGYCGPVSGGLVGYGTFIFPTTEHWLSGTDYRPDLNHFGVDFAGSLGNAVYAVDAGVIVYAGWNDWGYGNLIIVDHGNGWQSYYAHFSSDQCSMRSKRGPGGCDRLGWRHWARHRSAPTLRTALQRRARQPAYHLRYPGTLNSCLTAPEYQRK